jgi:hypothetical protein
MKHDDGTQGHNFACKVCGAWVSEYGCVRVLFPHHQFASAPGTRNAVTSQSGISM